MDGRMRGMDVAVLGGGPAGLAAAIALRQQGLRVALYDAQRPPIDKACGEGLMRQSVRILERLGVALGDRNGGCIAGISFHEGVEAARGRFRDGSGVGLRRTRLHGLLAARAVEAGVRLHWGAVMQANADGFASAGSQIHAGFFVIADGLCSTLAHATGFRQHGCTSTRYAFRQPFRCSPWSDMVEVHWGEREQIYVTPIGPDEVNIALLTARRGRRLGDALADFPAVARRLANAERTEAARGAVTKTCAMRQVVRGNVALIGDASGAVDAITGEGLLSAFRQAIALAEALSTGELEHYTEAHRRISRMPARMARLLLMLDRHPMLRRRSIAALAARPEYFAELLSLHLGEQSCLEAIRSVAGEIIRGRRTPVWPAPYKERGL